MGEPPPYTTPIGDTGRFNRAQSASRPYMTPNRSQSALIHAHWPQAGFNAHIQPQPAAEEAASVIILGQSLRIG